MTAGPRLQAVADRDSDAGSDAQVQAADAVQTVRRYHQVSRHLAGQEWAGSSDHPDFTPMDADNRPRPFKSYPGAPTTPLTTDLGQSTPSGLSVLLGDRPIASAPLDEQLLARLLFHAAGVTRVGEKNGVRTFFRAAPAAGNLHPVEVYVVNTALAHLAAGVSHFSADTFGLTELRPGDHRSVLSGLVADPAVGAAPVSLVLTGIPWRTSWKYSERGWRHVYWDAGTILANLLAVADAAGLTARVSMGFVDTAVSELLGIDGQTEFPLAVVTLTDEPARDSTHAPAVATTGLSPLAMQVEPLSERPWEFPTVVAAQHAGRLGHPRDVTTWRDDARERVRSGADTTAVVSERPEEPIESVIRRRGSTRVMKQAPVSRALLDGCLAAALRPLDGDGYPATEIGLSALVSVHAVEGLLPGRYRLEGGELVAHVTGTEQEVRATAKQLCLNQPLGGDAAFTVFLAADLEAALEAMGARGYRAVTLAAGVAAGRLQLASFALGCGGTGLTFYDDAVPAAFGTSDACLLVAAIGAPDYRPTVGGTPHQPAELTRQRALMDRLMAQLRQEPGRS